MFKTSLLLLLVASYFPMVAGNTTTKAPLTIATADVASKWFKFDETDTDHVFLLASKDVPERTSMDTYKVAWKFVNKTNGEQVVFLGFVNIKTFSFKIHQVVVLDRLDQVISNKPVEKPEWEPAIPETVGSHLVTTLKKLSELPSAQKSPAKDFM